MANLLTTSTGQIFTSTYFRPFVKKKSPKCANISTKFTRKTICKKINIILNNDVSASKFAKVK